MYNKTPTMAPKTIHELAIMDYEQRQAEMKAENDKMLHEQTENEKAFTENTNFVSNYINGLHDKSRNRARFLENAKVAFTSAALYKVARKAFTEHLTNIDENVLQNLITQFVTEQGAGKLLDEWKYKNTTLAGLGKVCREAYEAVRDKLPTPNLYGVAEGTTNIGSEDTRVSEPLDVLKLDKTSVDDFYGNLADVDTDAASAMIHDRVQDAMHDFIDQNAKNRARCEEIIDAAKEKIDRAENPDNIASIQAEATREVTYLKNYRAKNPFHYIVESITKAALQDENLKARNVNETNIDMDNIVHSAKLIYGFIETLNTLDAVDESYIKDYIKSAIED